MPELIERIGLARSIQIVIEVWNELILLLLLSTMLIGIREDKTNELIKQVRIPLTKELVIFYAAVFLYDLCNILDNLFGGMPTAFSYFVIRFGVFGYYLIGGFQTVFFLQVIKKHIAEALEKERLRNIITGFQLLQIPLFILLIVTPFTGALYQINAENHYERAWGYWIWQSVTILTFVSIGIVVIAYWRKIGSFLQKIILTATVFPIIGLVCGCIVPVSMNNVMVMIAALVMFMLYERNKTEITVRYAYELEKSKQELERSKVRLLVAQIQPHFIYNSLMAIQSKCTDNPVAYHGIESFGSYLRSNFTAMTSNEMIPFEEELKCIKAYLDLERLNYGEKLKVEYDIEIDHFMLPALCIEPLVENAVRYGIGTYKNGGMVRIIVRDEPDYIEIEVKDDGSGGNKLTDQQTKRKSIGLENVRLRLNASGMGTFSISQDETGTSAVVRLKYMEDGNENNND